MKGGGVERGKCLYMYVEAKERQRVDNDNGERRGCKKRTGGGVETGERRVHIETGGNAWV